MSITKVRASSWGSLFNCAYAWEGVHLLGIRRPASPRMILGTAIHAGTAAFDAARVLGQPISAYDASEVTVEALRHPKEDVDWKADNLKPKEAERIALTLHGDYCKNWSPRFEFQAVELATKPLVIDCGGDQFVELTGTLDRSRIIATSHRPRLGDVKSGANAVVNGVAKTKGHGAQTGTYQILYEHTTGEIMDDDAEIIGMKTLGNPEIALGTLHNPKQLMLGNEQFKGLIEIGAQMFRTGLFPPNPQSFTCSAKYCPRWKTCPYHE